ncbi:hypothetical protein [Halorhodospira halochloris]|nr:hypothetical protein [Halorhodospira halochloris]
MRAHLLPPGALQMAIEESARQGGQRSNLAVMDSLSSREDIDSGWFDVDGEVMVEVPAMICAAGRDPSTVYAAVAADTVAPETGAVAAGTADFAHAPVPVLSCSQLSGLGYAQRLEKLVEATASQLSDRIGRQYPDEMVMLPAFGHRVGRAWHAIAEQGLGSPAQRQLISTLPELSKSRWWTVPPGLSTFAVLNIAVRAISSGEVGSILIAGVDACASDCVVADPDLARIRRNTLQPYGMAPADGAGFVLLRRSRRESHTRSVTASKAAQGNAPDAAQLANLTFDSAAGGIAADEIAVRVRCAAPVDDMSQAASWVECLDSLLHSLPERWQAEVSLLGAFAADQALSANLRRSLDELRCPPELERISAWRGLGYAGAARLPLLLGLAIGRLLDSTKPVERVLATYGGAGSDSAGGIVLESLAAGQESC